MKRSESDSLDERAAEGRSIRQSLWRAITIILIVVACTTVAFTGRTQLRWISNADLSSDADRFFAATMTDARARGLVVSRSDSPGAAQALGTIERVAAKITEAAE